MTERIEENRFRHLKDKDRRRFYLDHYIVALNELVLDPESDIYLYQELDELHPLRTKGINFLIETRTRGALVPLYLCSNRRFIADHIRRFPEIPVIFLKDKASLDLRSIEELKRSTLEQIGKFLSGVYPKPYDNSGVNFS